MKNDQSTLGSLHRIDRWKLFQPSAPGTYRICDKDGKRILKLIPFIEAGYKNIGFKIVDSKTSKEIGQLKKDFVIKKSRERDKRFGATFPKTMMASSKTLIIGAMVLLVS